MMMDTVSDPYVSLEFTPNPNTLKYVVEVKFLDKGAANFVQGANTESSPLATELFKVPGVTGVMVGRNFVTVTKADSSEWDQIHPSAEATVKNFIMAGKPAVIILEAPALDPSFPHVTGTEVERQIKQILDDEIRPAVARDGGDISFDKYENGVVYLFMHGSCAGCPSSTMTLKMGIETRLKELIPEIQEVVAI